MYIFVTGNDAIATNCIANTNVKNTPFYRLNLLLDDT